MPTISPSSAALTAVGSGNFVLFAIEIRLFLERRIGLFALVCLWDRVMVT
jgi:hypothetical protein